MEEKITSVLGLRIKDLRTKLGLSQEALAECADLSQNHISQVERGIKGISHKTLIKIAEILKTSIAYLLGEKGNPADIGERIKRTREKRNLSQGVVAIQLSKHGVDVNTIASWESGKASVPDELIHELAVFLRTNTNYLYGKNDSASPYAYYDNKPVFLNDEPLVYPVVDSIDIEPKPIVFEYSKGDERVKLLIPPDISEGKIQTAIAEAVRSVTGGVTPKHESTDPSSKPQKDGTVKPALSSAG